MDTVERCYICGRTEDEIREYTREIELSDIDAQVYDLESKLTTPPRRSLTDAGVSQKQRI